MRISIDGLAFLSSTWNSVDIEAGATLDLAGVPSSFSNLTGSGTLTASETSSVTIAGGTFSGHLTGYLNLIVTGQLELAGSGTVGSIQIGNGGAFTSLTNEVGGLIDLDTSSDVSIAPGASAAYFINDGTVLRNGFGAASTVSYQDFVDQDPWAQLRRPMDMIRQGWSTRLFQASQQWSTTSS